MADLIFEVDYSDLQKAEQAVEKLGRASVDQAKRMEQGYRQLVSWQTKFAAELGKANAAIENQHRQQNLANKSARDSARVFEEAARAADKHEATLERLRMKFVEGHAAMDIYSKELNDLAVARQNDIITAEQQRAAIDQLNKELADGTIVQRAYSNGLNKSSRGIGQFSTFTQQAGYQVGDFLVQIQSGTNPLVAFGQQATQIAGTLTLFGGKLLFIGTALGIAIPLITALGAAFMRTRGETKTFQDQLDDLETLVGDLKSSQDLLSMSTRELGEKYGDAAESVRRYAIVEAQLRSAIAKTEMKEALSTLNDTVSAYSTLQDSGYNFRRTLDRLKRDFKTTDQGARLLEGSFTALASAIDFEQQSDAVNDLIRNMQILGISLNDIPKPVAQMLLNFIKANRTVEEAEQIIRSLEGAIDDSADGVRGITANLSDAVSEAIKLRDAMSAVGRASLGRQDQIKVLTSQIAAARAGTNVEVAKTGTETALELARGGATLDQIAAGVQTAKQEESTIQKLSKTLSDLTKPAGSSDGSSSGAAKVQEDYLAKLKLEADRKLQLAGLSEEEARIKEITYQLIDKGLPVEQGRIEAIVATEQALKKVTEAEKQRQQLMDTIEGHIENAFMSMVDGSKSVEDAFKSMLRNIILAIYQQQVAKPAATGIGNLISTGISALLGPGMTTGTPLTIPSSGVESLLPNFSGGGFTGYGPRSGGMDGKGGMLAMVHPNETVIDHTKGQSMGNVTVVQNFNMSANGDESVKRIIRQETPRIAEQAKAAVVDAKRRGGTYGRSF